MSEHWQYQIRFRLSPENATLVHSGKSPVFFGQITRILDRHNASAMCQFNAFAGYVAEAEKYVADNPYVEPKVTNSSSNKKTTINCIKGKATTKVTAINPKCPVGYKKK